MKQFKNLLGIDADDKTWILDDSGVVGKVLVCYNVLQKLFWVNQKCKITVGLLSNSRSAGTDTVLFANVSLPLVICLVSLSCPHSDMLRSML